MSKNLREEVVNLVKDMLTRKTPPTNSEVDWMKEIAKKYSILGWLQVIWKAYRKAVSKSAK
jgi:hypothetical protein